MGKVSGSATETEETGGRMSNPALKPHRDPRVIERLMDYGRTDPGKERDALVALWRKYHPEAAKEVSAALKPLMEFQRRKDAHGIEVVEFCNDTYVVSVRRYADDKVFGTSGGMITLGISALDGTAKHDFRDFQAIKNQLAGSECEAFELYPAESRLLDPSNYYTLWCFPGLRQLKVGNSGAREVYDADEAMAPQRAFPKESLEER
jgi:hypothetical protein